jgi:nicotinamide mononucleotide adenylyltransferase
MKETNHLPKFSAVGMIARWQPVHLGHLVVLQVLCQRAETVKIGVGSANVQNVRSPFNLSEVSEMLDLVLAGYDNCLYIPLPDLNDGPRWREMVVEKFGQLEVFFTANPYVRDLLKEVYTIRHPVEIVPAEKRIPVTGTQVRIAFAKGEPYQHLLPESVAAYLEKNNLIDRFRQQYGLETLALETIIQKE